MYRLKSLKGGHHECELFSGIKPEAAESEHNWQNCEKNPGHNNFWSTQDFIDKYLPLLPTGKLRDELRARIDLTVRLRVRCTSLDRPGTDAISHYRGTDRLRTGTGFVRYVSDPESNNPCLCDECDKCHGDDTRKHWRLHVQTALHVVYNTEEAKQTRIDLFYDDDNSQEDGRMKSVWGMDVIQAKPDGDWCEIFCVTYDEDLGERIKHAWRCWYDHELKPQDLSALDLLPSTIKLKEDSGPILMVSHPHAQPKKITVGVMTYHDKRDPCIQYNTSTCPGSSGAPVFVFDIKLEEFRFLSWISPVHSGSFYKTSTQPNIFRTVFNKWRRQKTGGDQINYGHKWAT